jgi:two-component system chemotaxis sensor kinase CheA
VRRLADAEALAEWCEEPQRAAAPLRVAELARRLDALRAGLAEDSARLDYVARELEGGIRAIRLLPLATVFALFPRLVHDLAQEQGKEAELAIEGGETTADKRVLEEIKDPLMHLLRNALAHGIEAPQERAAAGKPRAGSVRLRASGSARGILIEVSDDGRGLDEAAIGRAAVKRGLATEQALAGMSRAQLQRLIFSSGLSTVPFVTDVSGRGVGLDVVRANVERLKGTIELDSAPGRGTRIAIRLPSMLATVRVLIVEVSGHAYALPSAAVEEARLIPGKDVFRMEGADAVLHRGRAVSVARLGALLELPASGAKANPAADRSPCVFVTQAGETVGLLVDALLDEQEVVLKAQSGLLERVRNVAGARSSTRARSAWS